MLADPVDVPVIKKLPGPVVSTPPSYSGGPGSNIGPEIFYPILVMGEEEYPKIRSYISANGSVVKLGRQSLLYVSDFQFHNSGHCVW